MFDFTEHNVTEIFHVQFDSRTYNYFVVCRNKGSARYFTPGPDITTIHGTVFVMGDKDDDSAQDLSSTHTVKKNIDVFTQRKIKDATVARKF